LSRYRDELEQFKALDAQILGISTDGLEENRAFAKSLTLNFPVLSDPDKKVARLYGVLDEETGRNRRTTFVINKEGIVKSIEQGPSAIEIEGSLKVCRILKQPKEAE